MLTPDTTDSLIRGIDRVLIHTQDVERVFARFRYEFGLPVAWPITDCGLLLSGGLHAGNMTIEIGRYAGSGLPGTWLYGLGLAPWQPTWETVNGLLSRKVLHAPFPSLEFSHMGISIWRGKFNRTTGKVRFDRKARTGRAEIQIDAASIDFGHDKMNELVVTDDWLNVAAYPAMTYAGTLKFKGDVPVAMDEKLTLLGVTKPVPLKINSFKCMAHPMLKREVCGADAEGELNRADFGMTRYAEGEAGRIRVLIQVEAISDQ